ncbi:MAG TPA: NUDIX hydrolase [Polyangiales bacterium]
MFTATLSDGMPSELSPTGPTFIDRLFQVAYVCAYQLMRTYWKVAKPTTHGALITLWSGNEVLLVRNSYVPYYSLPGGYVRSGESGADAALRELAEEVGVTAQPEQLTLVLDETHDWQGKRDHVQIFAFEVSERPQVSVDHREVIEARWWTPEQALKLNLFPPLRKVIEHRQKELAVTRH